MKPFTQDDINTTVKVVKPLSQYDADLYEVPADRYVGQLARVSRVDLRNACGQLVSVMTDFGQVWLSADMLERGTLVQTWVPEVQSEEIPKHVFCASTRGFECDCPGTKCLEGSR